MDNTRKITKLEKTALMPVKRKRVAAYARVSSGKDAQLHSLSVQISYYNEYIGNRGDWQLVKIYADEAMTGTRDDRPQFQQLLTDCRAGKIDMVITKSVTRLARNTLTVLNTARELKSLGIDIYFEKENIHTMSSDGELMLTLLATFAQEESWSASENQKWRIRKKFEQGYPNTGNMLGYYLENGVLRVIPDEAEIVRQIYADFLSGMGINAIAKKLRRMEVPTKRGSEWNKMTVRHILRNEKYAGNLLLQKTYRLDHISKKQMINHGELPMYSVSNAHEAIIDRDTFEQVQQELMLRAEKCHSHHVTSEAHLFTSMIRCGLCGRHLHRKLASSSKKYAPKPVWFCTTAMNYGKNACPSRKIPEDILIQKTMEVLEIENLDRGTLLDHITEIQVPEHNHLVYVFHDGHTQEVTWRNHSRRESWTEEMKQQARERRLKYLEERRRP